MCMRCVTKTSLDMRMQTDDLMSIIQLKEAHVAYAIIIHSMIPLGH